MADPHEPEKRKTSFLDLPRELRDTIYEFALLDDSYGYHYIGSGQISRACLADMSNTFKSLHATGRQVSKESFETYYSKQEFTIDDEMNWHVTCNNKPRPNKKCLCDLAIATVRRFRLVSYSKAPHVEFKLSWKEGRWSATCVWRTTVSDDDDEIWSAFAAEMETQMEGYCNGKKGGMKRGDFRTLGRMIFESEICSLLYQI